MGLHCAGCTDGQFFNEVRALLPTNNLATLTGKTHVIPICLCSALASSAPLWQFPSMSTCHAFLQSVTSSFNASSPECANNIRKSWDALLDLTNAGTVHVFAIHTFICKWQSIFQTRYLFGHVTENGITWLNENWKPCAPVKTATDLVQLKNLLAKIYSNVAILNYPYPTNFTIPIPSNPVAVSFRYLLD